MEALVKVRSETVVAHVMSVSRSVTILLNRWAPVLRLLRRRVQRRVLDFLVVAGVALAVWPRARTTVAEWVSGLYRRLWLRLVRFGKPPLQKNLLVVSPTSRNAAKRLGAGATTASPSDFATFADLGETLPKWLAESLQREGFHHTKPIQRAVLPLALSGRDVIGIAPTGSGKTLAFLVPTIVHMSAQTPPKHIRDGPIALVLAPTRELVVQIAGVAESLLRGSRSAGGVRGSGGSSGFRSVALYGGVRRTDQLQSLQRQQSTHLFVATPGRLLDFMKAKAFSLRLVSFFVLDEGDRMLDYGFEEDVQAISSSIRGDRQMLFFSATWPPEVEQVAKRLCSRGSAATKVIAAAAERGAVTNGYSVCTRVGGDSKDDTGGACKDTGDDDDEKQAAIDDQLGVVLPPREIRQMVEVVQTTWDNYNSTSLMHEKLPLLLQHLEEALGMDFSRPPQGKALIFVKTRRAAEELGAAVAEHFGLERCGVIHGLRRQEQREAALRAFCQNEIYALVATDVLGRGVDIPGVSHVIIFDFPDNLDTYVHRVGRTGRNGHRGTSIAFFEPRPWAPELARDLAELLRSCGQEVPIELVKEEGRSIGQTWGSTGMSQHRLAPSLVELGYPSFATEAEMGEWNANGARVWGYSANGGVTEQGRIEFREGGLLRTTWGWGEWALHEALVKRVDVADIAATSPPRQLAITWGGCTDLVSLDAGGLSFELVSRNGRPAHTYKNKTVGVALANIDELD
eukprot:TRINITY_DN34657_c0_g2_i1.p1 TRINITY_DN34657_c0_g2~~TRINITY_DN34657_c0_g2_i1.p1  ORF type:complete len:740 (-),score=128.07 TRINITY_DN34657_c0_g2_i1:162-2381(-)